MPLPLPELFPDEDYRFHLTLRKGNLGGFFGSPKAEILAERRLWLQSEPGRYAAVTDEAEPLLDEIDSMAAGWSPELAARPPANETLSERMIALGRSLEPDLLFLSRDNQGAFRLRAGVVCFPSSWVLEEKMGLTMDEIHGPVPGLNAAIGAPIGQFLGKLKPGAPFERANWGLAATPDLNMHPNLRRPRLGSPLDLGKVWVRIEDQILAALPLTGGILFGIQVRVLPLMEIMSEANLRAGFHRAVATMPEPLAAYKGMSAIRDELLAVLND